MTLPLSMAECRKSLSLVKKEVKRLETFSFDQRRTGCGSRDL
jgi:hypothetical protein